VVVGVRPDSKAAKAGLQQGDLILEVDRQNVSSTGELKQLLAKHTGGDGIALLVQRANAGMMVLKWALSAAWPEIGKRPGPHVRPRPDPRSEPPWGPRCA